MSISNILEESCWNLNEYGIIKVNYKGGNDMERESIAHPSRWHRHRSTSILLLGISAVALMYVGKTGFLYASALIEQQRLAATLEELRLTYQDLQEENDRLRDPDYYSIYVEEHYLYNGENVIELP